LRLASEQAISKGQDLPLSVGQQFQHPLYITGKLPVAQKAPCSAKGRLADMKEDPLYITGKLPVPHKAASSVKVKLAGL